MRTDSKGLAALAALPSSRFVLDWSQKVLFAEAERGDRVVVCRRASRLWGLKKGTRYGKALYAPLVTPGGHFYDNELSKEIVAVVKNRINGCDPIRA